MLNDDGASLTTELVLGAVEKFSIDRSELHNDSTSITFSDRSATGEPRGGKATPVINLGDNNDHRADLKQLVWILTVSADGAVPLAYESRSDRIQRAVAALADLAKRVAGPRSRWHTRAAVEQAAERAMTPCHAGRWVHIEVIEADEETFRQERRGRPGEETDYRKETRTRFELRWSIDTELVAFDARSDGCFTLVTNDTELTDAQVLSAYKYQPHEHLIAPALLDRGGYCRRSRVVRPHDRPTDTDQSGEPHFLLHGRRQRSLSRTR